MVSVTPEFTVTLPVTMYGELVNVQVVGVEMVPLTLVGTAAKEGLRGKNKNRPAAIGKIRQLKQLKFFLNIHLPLYMGEFLGGNY